MSDSANKFVFRAMWPRTPSGGKTHTFVERLGELKQGREEFMTEEVYQQIRSEILRELATRRPMPKMLLVFFVLLTFGLGGVTLWFFLTQGMTGIWVLLLPLTFTVAAWYHQARDYASKRRLSVQQRVHILDELVSAGLLSQNESATLKVQIESLPATDDI